jgi:NTE family protein
VIKLPLSARRLLPSASGHLFKRLWRTRLATSVAPAHLNLALQGGGAHGAFTWGVLDALLQDPRMHFEGISGSSAGAMNAVVMAQGWMTGGREGAREALAQFWGEVSQQLPWGMLTMGGGDAISLSPATKMLAQWAGFFSPTELNPLAINPLRSLLKRQIDFERLRSHSPFKLFVGATQVNTGKLRLFREHELTLDMLLASACLPKIHHTVEVDGEPYWDGGFAANPAVFPLFYDCTAADVLLVLLAPLKREGTPHTKDEIETRMEELGFKAHFMREMQMFARTQLAARAAPQQGTLEQRLQRARFHMIDSSNLESLQRSETKMLAHAPFLTLLHDQGLHRGQQWLAAHASAVGQRGTLDMQQWLA